jgi:predicted transcriptional regulator
MSTPLLINKTERTTWDVTHKGRKWNSLSEQTAREFVSELIAAGERYTFTKTVITTTIESVVTEL